MVNDRLLVDLDEVALVCRLERGLQLVILRSGASAKVYAEMQDLVGAAGDRVLVRRPF